MTRKSPDTPRFGLCDGRVPTAGIVAFALPVYVILDGFDLGPGDRRADDPDGAGAFLLRRRFRGPLADETPEAALG